MPAPLALVTGGKRRLGAEIAKALAKAGYALALVSHVDKEPDADLRRILSEQNSEWQAFTCDLGDPENAAKLVADVTAHFGRPANVLVNNAAMFGQDDWHGMDLHTLQAHFRLNLFTPLLLAKEIVQAAQGAGRPAIVHILDQRITNPHGDQISYTLSKQALAAATITLARALAPGVRVNAVAPGLTLPTEEYRPAQMVALEAMMPLGRLPEPDQIADAVAWLANAEAVTGQTIFVDGGASLKSFERDFVYLGSADTVRGES